MMDLPVVNWRNQRRGMFSNRMLQLVLLFLILVHPSLASEKLCSLALTSPRDPLQCRDSRFNLAAAIQFVLKNNPQILISEREIHKATYGIQDVGRILKKEVIIFEEATLLGLYLNLFWSIQSWFTVGSAQPAREWFGPHCSLLFFFGDVR